MKGFYTFLALSSIIFLVQNYNTMPPVAVPSTVLKAFSSTWVNVIGGSPHSEPVQQYTTITYPSGFTFSAPPRISMAITRY